MLTTISRVLGGGHFGHAVGAGEVVGAGHPHTGAEAPCDLVDPLVVSGNDRAASGSAPWRRVRTHAAAWFWRRWGEDFAGETGGGESRRDHAQDFTRHTRSYHKTPMLDLGKKGWQAVCCRPTASCLCSCAIWFACRAVGRRRPAVARTAGLNHRRAKPPARQAEVLPKRQYPRRQHPGADSGDRDRSAEPVRDRPGQGEFQGLRGQEGAGDHAVFERGRAAFGGRDFRLQRQHGAQAGKIAPGGGAILQDGQSGGRVLPGAVQRRRRAGAALHAQPGRDPEPPDLHPVQGPDRAAGRDLPGAARDEEGQEPAQGAADDLRWRRQQQPLHRKRNQEPGEGSGRPDLCDRNLRADRLRAAARRRKLSGPGPADARSPSRPAGGNIRWTT